MPRVSQNHDGSPKLVDCNQFLLDEPLGYSTRTDEFTLDPGISMNLYSDTILNLPPEGISL